MRVDHKEGLKTAKAEPEHSLRNKLKMILKWCVKGFGRKILSSHAQIKPETDSLKRGILHIYIYGTQAVLQDCGTLFQWIYFE